MFCPNCGTKSENGNRFCTSCGIEFSLSPSAKSVCHPTKLLKQENSFCLISLIISIITVPLLYIVLLLMGEEVSGMYIYIEESKLTAMTLLWFLLYITSFVLFCLSKTKTVALQVLTTILLFVNFILGPYILFMFYVQQPYA